ncbi:hypothetical protein D9619_002342 [Psilocybe cf. subviscida]|uniref:Uncharacterized protein n=1 Tax=Psilocybe cf. subviscida TaxID=2480587 RepID=A0A8H5AYD3_9AGAR|nr:hypothetical protein D9619_002342 [Psilocybe cf. subviscida]
MSVTVENDQPRSLARGGLRRLFANVSVREISRTLVRREVPLETETTRLSMFGHGQDTHVQNSTINTTVNYHYTMRNPLDANSTEGASQQNNVQPFNENGSVVDACPPSTTIEPDNDNVQCSMSEKTRMPRDARDVYEDIMITKNHGFPLWIPTPNTFLPPDYRYSGVSIGDVGVITPEGAFDFFFNIFADASDPIHANSRLPDIFSPLRPPLRDYEIQRFKENMAGTVVGDDSFRRTDDVEDSSKVILTTSASEAAVLMMPEDVYVVKIRNQERLRKYVSAHLTTWYTFVRQTLGHDIGNGDLRVVYGCRKSTAFGIAAISTAKTPAETRLTFCESESWARQSGYKYRWSQVGSAHVKAGPEYRESIELMHPTYGTTRTLPENLCLFISTVDAKLSEEAWKSVLSLPILAVDTMRSELSPSSSLNQGFGHCNSAGGEHPSAVSSTKNPAIQVLLGKSSEASLFNESAYVW